MKCALLTQNCVLIMAAALYTEPGHCVCVLYTSLARVFSGTTHLMLMCLGLCLATITSCEDLVRLIRLIIDCVIGIMYNWIAGLCQLSVCVCVSRNLSPLIWSCHYWLSVEQKHTAKINMRKIGREGRWTKTTTTTMIFTWFVSLFGASLYIDCQIRRGYVN